MFSDSGAPAPGEQKGFKPHTPHFIPWLRNSLKAHHSSDLGLNGPYKTNSEAHNSLTPLERAKGISFFSIQGKDRAKKGELRCNGVGMARMLPVMLRGHHILPGTLGKQKEDRLARWNHNKDLDSDPGTQASQGERSQGPSDSSYAAEDNYTFVRNHGAHLSPHRPKSDGTNTSVRKYGPVVGPTPVPVTELIDEEPNCKVPVVMCVEDRSGKVWDYASHTTYHQRDLHSSSWLSADSQGLIERQHGFSSSFSYINKHSRNSQSQRDLTALREPPVEAVNGPLSRVVFSTEVPHRGLSCTTTLRDPRKPRPSSERISIRDQNQTWVQPRPVSVGDSQSKNVSCTRKVVRNQIKRVVDNLEQVLKALRDVHEEMREVVHQIDNLTSTIDLIEEEEQHGAESEGVKLPSDGSHNSGSSEIPVGSPRGQTTDTENQRRNVVLSGMLRRNHHRRSWSPVPPNSSSSGILSDRSRTLRFTCSVGSSPRQSGSMPSGNSIPTSTPSQLQNIMSPENTLSAPKNLPVRPPTPGLSPLTVNLHQPGSPGSRPQSPGASSSSIKISPISPGSPLSHKLFPPPVLGTSAMVDSKIGSYEAPQSNLPSAGMPSPSSNQTPSPNVQPTELQAQTVSPTYRERRSSSAGPSQADAASTSPAKPFAAQSRRGRKPPPYPHHRFSENTKKAKEPRKAPPYPEKRRLLSTTV